MIINNQKIEIFFGDKKTAKSSEEWYKNKDIILLKQIHSNLGLKITNENLNFFKNNLVEGDYLITNLKNLKIGVLTADCLPIVICDKANQAIGIAHAGWQGSVQEIVKKMFFDMQKNFSTSKNNIEFYFGPCAKVCCYEVKLDFLKNINNSSKTILEKNGKLFFNLPLFNQLQLEDIGISKDLINQSYNLCTICSDNFCSVRKEPQSILRQITSIKLI